MHRLSSRNLLVAAALFGIAAESAWAQEAASGVPVEAAAQPAAPAASEAPAYAPAPYQRGYEQYWQPPPWPEPPPGYYGHYRPYYLPHRAYRAAPPENPLSAELKQTQEQLAAKDSELDTANEQLTALQTDRQATAEALQQAQEQLAARNAELDALTTQLAGLQAEQAAIREVLQEAQGETAKASEQLSIVVEEMDILFNVLSELKARLDLQSTSLSGAVQAGAETENPGESAVEREAAEAEAPAAEPAGPGESEGDQSTPASDTERAAPGAI